MDLIGLPYQVRGRPARCREGRGRVQDPQDRRGLKNHARRSGAEEARRMIFNAFERLVAMRYLRARRQEGFVSVIAAFSLLGIALGVGHA